jgi:hypothetical protein
MDWHTGWQAILALGSLGALRGVAWCIALFGSERYSKRAMRLLRRPPVESAGHLQGTPDFLLHGTPGQTEKAQGADLSQAVNRGDAEKAELTR